MKTKGNGCWKLGRTLFLASAVCSLSLARAQDSVPKSVAEVKLGAYGVDEAAAQKIKTDISAYFLEAQRRQVFPKADQGRVGAMFEKHWQRHLAQMTTPASFEALGKELTVREVSMILYSATLADVASELDAEDPATEKNRAAGLLSRGGKYIEDHMDEQNGAGIAIGLLLGVAGKWMWDKLSQAVVLGPGTQLTNTAVEPFIRPVRERLEQEVNTRLGPKLVKWGWNIFWTGERGRQKKALKSNAEGAALTHGAERYLHPAVSVPDFVEDHRKFFEQAMAAESLHRGWIAAELGRAREKGFELIYNNTKYLNEQLNTFSNAEKQSKMFQALVTKPQLLKGGASEADMKQLGEFIQKQQDLLVFKGSDHPDSRAMWEPIVGILKKWSALGIEESVIYDFYRAETDIVMAKNRAAFSLASFLDAERYFQEYNIAIGKLYDLQKWQELGKDMSGIYNGLREHRARIEAYFKRRGIDYNVTARVEERGSPLGGPMRAKDKAPYSDEAMNFLETADPRLNASIEVIPLPESGIYAFGTDHGAPKPGGEGAKSRALPHPQTRQLQAIAASVCVHLLSVFHNAKSMQPPAMTPPAMSSVIEGP